MNIWNVVSLLLELAVVILGLMLALHKGKFYGWLIALTFTIYVIYDLVRFLAIDLAPGVLDMLFTAASLSVFLGLWGIYASEK